MAAASQWAVIAFCARFYGATELGQYAFVLAVVSPIFILAGMNFRQLVSSLPEENFHPVLLVRVQRYAILTAILAALAYLFFDPHRGHQLVQVFLAAVALKSIDTNLEGRYGFWQRHGAAVEIAWRKTLRAVMSVLVFCAVAKLGGSLALSLSAIVVLYLILAVSTEHFQIDPTERMNAGKGVLLTLLKFGAISGCAAAVDSLVVMLPRFRLGSGASFSDVGVFTLLIQIPVVLAVMVSGIGQALIPKIRIKSNSHDRWRILRQALLITVGLAAVGFIFVALGGGRIMALLYGAEYEKFSPLLVLAMLGGGFWYLATIMGYALQGIGNYSYGLISVCAAAMTATIVLLATSASVEHALYAYISAMAVRLALSSYFFVRANGVLTHAR